MAMRPDTALANFRAVLAALADEYPDLSLDDLRDTADGEAGISDLVVATLRKAREADVMASALAEIIKTMQARKARFGAQEERFRGIAQKLMEDAGLSKVVAPDMTVTLASRSPKPIVTDESALPIEYLVPMPPKPDLAAIKAAMQAGTAVPGVEWSNASQSLTVRTS